MYIGFSKQKEGLEVVDTYSRNLLALLTHFYTVHFTNCNLNVGAYNNQQYIGINIMIHKNLLCEILRLKQYEIKCQKYYEETPHDPQNPAKQQMLKTLQTYP